MKKEFRYILIVLVFLASCAKDDYDEPSATLGGRIVYQGEPVNVEEGQVRFELWQPGWGKLTPIGVPIKQDGAFSTVIFDGNYKLVFPGGQGPFMTVSSGSAKDTIAVAMKGSRTMDIEVIPYYLVRNAQFSYSGGQVTANCRIDKIITDVNAKDIERVTLYINKTQFVSNETQIANANLSISPATNWSNVSISVNVPALVPAQNYVFARVGVKIAGIEDLVFSPLAKVEL